MLHPMTNILTPSGMKTLEDIQIGEEVSTIYGQATVQNKTRETKRLFRIILDGEDKIFYSPDQTFLIKTIYGYSFKCPVKYDEVVCFGNLMELRKIHSLDSLSSSEFIKIHLKQNFSLLINGSIVAKA
jgi:hypothetical protein